MAEPAAYVPTKLGPRSSAAHGIVNVRALATGTSDTVDVGGVRAPTGILWHPTVTDLSTDQSGLAITLTANQFLGEFLYVLDCTSSNATFAFPTATNILSYFEAAGRPLEVGDMFEFLVCRGHTGTFAVVVSGNTGITYHIPALTNVAVGQDGTCLFVVRLVSVSPATMVIYPLL